MKPTSQVHEIHARGDSCTRRQLGSAMPAIDFNYMAKVPADFSGGRGDHNRKASFRAISADYFAGDARSTFVCEGALFAAMAAIVAFPVLEGARGVLRFVSGAGVL